MKQFVVVTHDFSLLTSDWSKQHTDYHYLVLDFILKTFQIVSFMDRAINESLSTASSI
jgi:hypothetical protein